MSVQKISEYGRTFIILTFIFTIFTLILPFQLRAEAEKHLNDVSVKQAGKNMIVTLTFSDATSAQDVRVKPLVLKNPPTIIMIFLDNVKSTVDEYKEINQGCIKAIKGKYIFKNGKQILDNISINLTSQANYETHADANKISITLMPKGVKAEASEHPRQKAVVSHKLKSEQVTEAEAMAAKKKAKEEAKAAAAKAKADREAARKKAKEEAAKKKAEAKAAKMKAKEEAKAAAAKAKADKKAAKKQTKINVKESSPEDVDTHLKTQQEATKQKAEAKAAKMKAKEEAKAAAAKAKADKKAARKKAKEEAAKKKAEEKAAKMKAKEEAKAKKTKDMIVAASKTESKINVPAQEGNKVKSLLDKGKQLQESGNYDDALITYNQVLALEPGNKKAINAIMRVQKERKKSLKQSKKSKADKITARKKANSKATAMKAKAEKETTEVKMKDLAPEKITEKNTNAKLEAEEKEAAAKAKADKIAAKMKAKEEAKAAKAKAKADKEAARKKAKEEAAKKKAEAKAAKMKAKEEAKAAKAKAKADREAARKKAKEEAAKAKAEKEVAAESEKETKKQEIKNNKVVAKKKSETPVRRNTEQTAEKKQSRQRRQKETVSKTQKISILVGEGKDAYNAGNHTLAIEKFTEVLEIDGRNRTAKTYITKSQQRLGEANKPAPKQDVFSEEVAETSPEGPQTEIETILTPAEKENISISNQEPLYITLDDCINISRNNTLTVRIAREEIELAKLKIKTARRGIWPSWDVLWKETKGTTTGQDFEGRELTLEMQYPIYSSGKNSSLYKQAKINYEISKQNFQKEIIELDFKVEQAYLLLANAILDVTFLKELKDYIVDDLKSAKERYDLGLSRKVELLRVESQEVEVNYKLQAAEKDMELAHLTLKQVLNSKNDQPFYIDAELGKYLLDASMDQLVDLALSNRQDLKVNALLVEYNKLGTTVANSEYGWNVNVEGAVGANGEAFITESLDMTNEWFVGLKVTKALGDHTLEDNFISQDKVPSVGQTTSTEFTSNTLKLYLWNNTARQNMKEADIKFLKSVDEYIKKVNSIIFEVRKNYFEYLKSIDQLESNRLKVQLNKEQLKIQEARSKINETLTSELLDTKDRLYKASIDLEEARTGYYTAIANINKSIGITNFFDFTTAIKEKDPVPNAWKLFLNNPADINIEGYGEFLVKEKAMEHLFPEYEATVLNNKKEDKSPRTRRIREMTPEQLAEKEARAAQKKAAAARKEQISACIKEGNTLYKDDKYADAIASYEKVLAVDPENKKAKSLIDKSQKALKKASEQEQK